MGSFENPVQNKNEEEVQSQLQAYAENVGLLEDDAAKLQNVSLQDFKDPENIASTEIRTLVEQHKLQYLEFLRDQMQLNQSADAIQNKLHPLLKEVVKLDNSDTSYISPEEMAKLEQKSYYNLRGEILLTREKLGLPPAQDMEQEIRDLIARKLLGITSSKLNGGNFDDSQRQQSAKLLGDAKSDVVRPFLTDQIIKKKRRVDYEIEDALKSSLAIIAENSDSLRKELFQELHKKPSKKYAYSEIRKREGILDVIAQIKLSDSEKETLYKIYKGKGDYDIKGGIANILGQNDYQKALPAIEKSLHSKDPSKEYSSDREEIEALGKLGNSSSIPVIFPFLESSENYTCNTAIRALGAIGDSSVVPTLLSLLDNAKQQHDVVSALENIKDKRAVEPLLLLLEKPESDSYGAGKYKVVEALLNIGQPIGLEKLIPLIEKDSLYTMKPLLPVAIEHEQDIHTLIRAVQYTEEWDEEYHLIISKIQEVSSAQDIIKALQVDKMNGSIRRRLISFLQLKDDDERTTTFLKNIAEKSIDFPKGNADSDHYMEALSSTALRSLAKRQDFSEALELYSHATHDTQTDILKELARHTDVVIPLIESNEQYFPLALEMAHNDAGVMYPHLHKWIKDYAQNPQLGLLALEHFSQHDDPGKKVCSFLYKLLREYGESDPSLREKAVAVLIKQQDQKAAHILRPIHPEYLRYFQYVYDDSKQCNEPLEKLLDKSSENPDFNTYEVIRAILFQEKESGISLAIEAGHISMLCSSSFVEDIRDPQLILRLEELTEFYKIIGHKTDEIVRNLDLNLNTEEDRKFVLRIARQYKNRAVDVFGGIHECYSEGILYSDNRNEIFPYLKGLNMITPLLVRGYIDARNKDAFFEQIQEMTERLIFHEDQIKLSELTSLERDAYRYLTRFDISEWRREYKNFDTIISSVEKLPNEQRLASPDFSSPEIIRLKSVPREVDLEKFKEPYGHVANFLSETTSYKGDSFYQKKIIENIESEIDKKQKSLQYVPEKAHQSIQRSIEHLTTIKTYALDPNLYKDKKQQELGNELEKLKERSGSKKISKEIASYELLLESTEKMSSAEILIDIVSAEKMLLKNSEEIIREMIIARHLQRHKKQLQETEDLVEAWTSRQVVLAKSEFAPPQPLQKETRDDLAEQEHTIALDRYLANIQPILKEHPIMITKIEQVLELFGTQIKDHAIGNIDQPEHGEDWQYPALTQKQRDKLKRIFSFSELTKAFDEYRKYQGTEMPDDFYLLPSRSVLGETSGYYNDACWTSQDDIIRDNPNMTPIACARKLNNNVEIIGGGLVFENNITVNDKEEKVLIVRGVNLQNRVLEEISADSYCEEFINRVKKAAQKQGIQYIMADTSSGKISNRPGIVNYFKSHYPAIDTTNDAILSVGKIIPLNKEMDFNNYRITDSCHILEILKESSSS